MDSADEPKDVLAALRSVLLVAVLIAASTPVTSWAQTPTTLVSNTDIASTSSTHVDNSRTVGQEFTVATTGSYVMTSVTLHVSSRNPNTEGCVLESVALHNDASADNPGTKMADMVPTNTQCSKSLSTIFAIC